MTPVEVPVRQQAEAASLDGWARVLFDAIDDAIFVHDLDGRILEANPAACRRLGYTRAEMLQLNTRQIDAPEFAAGYEERLRQQLNQRNLVCEGRHITRDGRIIPVDINTSTIEVNGRPAVLAVIRDITERKRAEEALRKQTTLLQSILDHMGDAVIVADENEKFLLFNPAAERLFGLGSTDATSSRWSKHYGLFRPDRTTPLPADEHPLMLAIGGQAVQEVEIFVRHEKAPEGVWVSVTGRPLRDGQGTVRGGIIVCRDVTERKRTESRLAAQYAVTRALAESATLKKAAPRILEAVGTKLDWDVGALWSADRASGAMRCMGSWHAPEVQAPRFLEMTRRSSLAPGAGLPGKVWASGKPLWLTEIDPDPAFARSAMAVAEGLRGAFAVPIRGGHEVIGVLEFFSRGPRSPDADLLLMMTALGSQVGQFIERKRNEDESLRLARKLRLLLESTGEGIYGTDAQGRCTFINHSAAQMLGYQPEEVLGRDLHEMVHHRHANGSVYPLEQCPIFQSFSNRDSCRVDTEVFWRKDGAAFPVEYASYPIVEEGTVRGMVVTFIDITERKKAEDEVKRVNAFLDSIVENIPTMLFVKDADTLRFERINRAAEDHLGYRRHDLVGKTDYDFFPREQADFFTAKDREVLAGGRVADIAEEPIQTSKGLRIFHTRKMPILDEKGQPRYLLGISEDVTERNALEEARRQYAEAQAQHARELEAKNQALQDSEALYHSLVECLPQSIYRKDRQGRFTFANHRFCAHVGRPLEDVLDKTDLDLFPAALAEAYRQDDRQVIESGTTLEKIEEAPGEGGSRRHVQVVKTPVYAFHEEIIGTQGIFWDVTETLRAQEAVQESERRYRQLTQCSIDAIVVADQEERITLFNPAAERTFGYPAAEVLGQSLRVLMPEEYRETHRRGFERFLATREPKLVGRMVELRGRRKDGSEFPLELSLSAVDLGGELQFLGAMRDLTERNRMRSVMLQTEKLASIGMLSAGVAHEINNPLAYVSNNLVVLERDTRGLLALLEIYEQTQPALAEVRPELLAEVRTLAEKIDLPYIRTNFQRLLSRTREGVQRVTRIVHSLSSLARTAPPQLQEASIPDLVEASLEIIRGKLRRQGVEVEQHYGAGRKVRCVTNQLSQVLLNLLVNALQAIEANKGKEPGRIKVSTERAGDHLVIEVADNGCGIDANDLPRLFDPFFTTKPVGEGTGLGLSITHNIVTGHGGRIEVNSSRGQGSRFRVYLPLEPNPQTGRET